MKKTKLSLIVHKKLLPALFLVASSILILNGCSAGYKIGVKQFDSSEDALKYQADLFAEFKNQITPSKKPVGGIVLILIPSDDEITRNYIRYGQRTRKEDFEFILTGFRENIQYLAEAIVIRQIFDSAQIRRHDGNPANTTVGDNDFLIFCDVDGWSIKGKNKPNSILIKWNRLKGADKNIAVQNAIAFLDAISQKADELRTK
jgi:hypothetical protein